MLILAADTTSHTQDSTPSSSACCCVKQRAAGLTTQRDPTFINFVEKYLYSES